MRYIACCVGCIAVKVKVRFWWKIGQVIVQNTVMMQSRSNHTAKSGQFIVQNSRYGAKSLTLFCFKTAIVRCVFYEVRIGFLNTVKSISRINNLKLLVVA